MGANIVGYSLSPSTEPSLFEIAKVAEGMTSVVGDIRDQEHLEEVCRGFQPEIVLHLAAQALVRYSYSNPVETYSTNVMGLVNLLEAVRKTPSVRAMVNVTSDKCYENREWPWGYRENEAMGGFDPYSNSKGCAELVTAAYRNSFFSACEGRQEVALATARAGNVIGGGDWAADRLIPDIMRAISEARPVLIRSPHAIRPWQHVLEPLSGYLELAQKLYEDGSGYAEAWNFGPSDEDARSVQWIVEQLTEQWGEGASWLLDQGNHPHEAHYLKLDCSKAKMRLDWQSKWSLAQALKNIVAWQKAYQLGKNMREFSLGQIASYSEINN
jgi:CDP-glucose 4,6-dehydratase